MPTDSRFYFFGNGALYGLDNSQALPTPIKFGTVQEVSVEFNLPNKDLHGGRVFPLAQGEGKGSIKCKAKLAKIQALLLSQLFFKETAAAGEIKGIEDEIGTIPTTPYKLIVLNGATFHSDLGVRFATTGVPLTRVAATPTTGQYSLVEATGEYTFAAADTTKEVLFDYLYTAALTGYTIPLTNRKMGIATTFKAVLFGVMEGKNLTLILNQCVTNKLGAPFKQEGFLEMELDWEVQGDAANQVGLLSLSQ